MTKTLNLLTLLLLASTALVSCNDYETYGEKKDKERNSISEYIQNHGINVISEEQFHAQGDLTDNSQNQYVYMNNNGVYMQIVHKGCGKPLQNGERADLQIRFYEVCLMDSSKLYNDTQAYNVDLMTVSRTNSTFTASFTQGLMKSTYGESVPTGWLVPLSYVNVGQERSEDDEIAKVNLIVPHTQGHAVASSYVYPYYYEISFRRQIDLYD